MDRRQSSAASVLLFPRSQERRPLLIVGFAFALLVIQTPPTAAQWHFQSDFLDSAEISDELRAEGFHPTSRPMLNRDVYLVDAVDAYGERVRVIVSAFDGRIIQTFLKRDDAPVASTRRSAPHSSLRPGEKLYHVAPPPSGKQAKATSPNPAFAPGTPPTVVKRSPTAIPKDSGPAAPESAQRPPAPVLTPPRDGSAALGTNTPRSAPMPPPALLDDAVRRIDKPPTPAFPPALLE